MRYAGLRWLRLTCLCGKQGGNGVGEHTRPACAVWRPARRRPRRHRLWRPRAMARKGAVDEASTAAREARALPEMGAVSAWANLAATQRAELSAVKIVTGPSNPLGSNGDLGLK